MPRRKLENRFEMFFSGQWSSHIADARMMSEAASTARVRKRRRQGDGRAVRAEKLAMMGELSSARQALESMGVAPGDQNTLNALRSPERRLRAPRAPLPQELREMVPDRKFELDEECFCRNLSARRGAAPGPSGSPPGDTRKRR